MTVLFIVLPIALFMAGVFVVAFIWATRHGQFDDLTTPAHRILTDDARTRGQKGPPGPAGENGRAGQA
jgi:cbb3-type cytochrome oxidase maturation protein